VSLIVNRYIILVYYLVYTYLYSLSTFMSIKNLHNRSGFVIKAYLIKSYATGSTLDAILYQRNA